jgi:DNA-binding NtrC family response regulator
MSDGELKKIRLPVLVADDEVADAICDVVQSFCEQEVTAVSDLEEAVKWVRCHAAVPHLILLDLNWEYPDPRTAYQVMDWLRGRQVDDFAAVGSDLIGSGLCGVLMMSAYATLDERVAAKKREIEILQKMALVHDVDGLLIKLLDLQAEMERRRRWAAAPLPEGVIGESPALIQAYRRARFRGEQRLSEWMKQHIFIFGEQGTGKAEMVQEIHRQLGLNGKPLHIDCANIGTTTDGQMAHSFFFGHIKGSFAGAVADQPGQFDRLKDEGLIHIDNLHALKSAAQQPLVSFLEFGAYTPVGGAALPPKVVKGRARLVVTTSADPEAARNNGELSNDVFRRLTDGGWFITIPPVRERGHDIILLATYFCARWKVSDEPGGTGMELMPQARDLLLNADYSWRTNVSDVSGMMTRACESAHLDLRRQVFPEDFPFTRRAPGPPPASLSAGELGASRKQATDDVKHRLICDALRKTNGNITEAAGFLDYSRQHLSTLIKDLGIDVKQFRSSNAAE